MLFKGFKKGLTMMMAVVMLTGILSGCQKATPKTTEEPATTTTTETTTTETATTDAAQGVLDTSEEVELVMYVVSDRPAGQDVFDENLNKILKEKLNCTLKTNWIGWAEFSNKYPLLFSSGEQFDLAYGATWLNFSALAQNGAFMNLDDLWEKYAPKNFARQPEVAKSEATVNGHYYAVPTLKSTYSAYGPIYRKDLVEGSAWNGKMETFADIEAYCDIVKATHPELDPIDIYAAGPDDMFYNYMGSNGMLTVDKGSPFVYFDPNEAAPKVIASYEFAGFTDYLTMMARWNEKGFYSKSALADTDSSKTQNGKAALKFHNVDTYREYSILHPEWSFQFSNLVKEVAHLPFTQDCMVISNTSQNPERALAFWDLVTNDQEVYNAMVYGVLGTTYELNDKNQVTMKDTDLYNTSPMWAARTNEFDLAKVGTPDEYKSYLSTFESSIQPGVGAEKYAGFVFDVSSIETEMAACKNVQQQYGWALELGYVDMTSGLADYTKQMQAAGIDKIKAVAQEQLDAYIAGLK